MIEDTERLSGLGRLAKEQDSMLLAAGFEPLEGTLWRRDGVHFGREAAMQSAQRDPLRCGGYPRPGYVQTPAAEGGEAS